MPAVYLLERSPITARFEELSQHLHEQARRLITASEAHVEGRGGVIAVSAVTWIARRTIGRGLPELGSDVVLSPGPLAVGVTYAS